jgi:hypothetical protein
MNMTHNDLKQEAFKRVKLFCKNVEKNMNNYIISDSFNDPTKHPEGYCLRIDSIYGVKKSQIKKQTNERTNLFLKFNLTFFNPKTLQFFGNTYRSPILRVKVNETLHYELAESNPLFVYFLANVDPTAKGQAYIVFEILLVEMTEDNRVLSQTCEGWGLLDIENQNNLNSKGVTSKVYLGTPRNLLYKNMKSRVFLIF